MVLSWFQCAAVFSCILLAGAYVVPQDNGLKSFSAAGSHSTTEDEVNEVVVVPQKRSLPATTGKTSSSAPASLSYSVVQTDTPDNEDTSANADAVAYAGFENKEGFYDEDGFYYPSAKAELDLSVENPNSGDTDDDNEWITRKSSKSSNTVTVRQAVVEQEPGKEPVVRWKEAVATAETEGSVCTGSGEGEDVQNCLKEGSKAKSNSYTVATSGEHVAYLQ